MLFLQDIGTVLELTYLGTIIYTVHLLIQTQKKTNLTLVLIGLSIRSSARNETEGNNGIKGHGIPTHGKKIQCIL